MAVPDRGDLEERIKRLEEAEEERRKTEEELHTQKTYLEELFRSAPEAIILHDNNDIIINVNEEFTRVFGYTREEAVGRPINDLITDAEWRSNADMLSASVLSGKGINVEAKRMRQDGSLIDVSILGAPIVRDGVQIGVYAIYRDITVRKRAEEELFIEKTHFEELFRSAPEAIILHDNDDFIMNVNEEFTRMFGYTREEAIGRPINDLIASAEWRGNANGLSAAVLRGDRVNVEAKRRRRDGSLIDVSILGAPIIKDGVQYGVYAIYRDITESKKAEEARIKQREEARMAREIQINLLPKSIPEVPGYEIAGKNVPALHVGGDYYDFLPLDEGRLAVALGDVSGKGLPASMLMANLQATIRSQACFKIDVRKCLEMSNKLLFHSTDNRTFVSLFYGILDLHDHTLSYANAGQNMPLLFSRGQAHASLKTRGLALGIREDVSYEREEIQIRPGDLLLIYTDGITEAMDEDMEEFGDEKLRNIVRDNLNEPVSELIERVFDAALRHSGPDRQTDDMTMIILKRT